MGEDTQRERERERAGAKNRRYLESEREREREIDRIAITASEWRGCSMESRRRWGLFSVYICRSITLDPVGCRCVGRVSMLRRGRPARGQGNESRNADFRPSPFHSCLLSLSISLLLTDNPCFTLSKRQALWILAKSTGNSHPSSIGCHFSSEVARLDKC